MRVPRWPFLPAFVALLALLASAHAGKQDPAPPSQPSTATPEKPKNQKYSHANDFLILGTVFGPAGLAFPAVKLRVRRSAEKKFRWVSYTNSRGEFAVRVPQGTAYEMVVHAKGFAEQSRQLDAKTGANEIRIMFRMEPLPGEKK